MRDYILLYVNGRRCEIRERDAFLSLSDFLRRRQGLIGTKIVCSEGDCGACTVLVGRPVGGRIEYAAVDACIQFVFQLDGTHIVTVEGLAEKGQLNDVQQSLVDCHGSQCGFCTPGFAVAMTGMLESGQSLEVDELRYGLTGNLCRCTGYTSILDAGVQTDAARHVALDKVYRSAPMLKDFAQHAGDNVEIDASWNGESHMVSCPVDLDHALRFLAAHPDASIIAGATDIGVRINKTQAVPATILDLNRVAELQYMNVAAEKLEIGARASWTEIEQVCEDLVPQFHYILTVFGSPQIRNVGTIGGNIINASPIADALPFLHVMEATLQLQSTAGVREVNINDFYRGYKSLDLREGELLTRIDLPLPAGDDLLALYKVSRRRDLDISGFTAAIRMRLDGDAITEAAIAYGAVGPTVVRAWQTEDFLQGKPFAEETMQQAGDIAVGEVTPISDVRGSADYRLQLTRNVLRKFFFENQPELTAV